jgi:DNA-binding response OmpR family regulator
MAKVLLLEDDKDLADKISHFLGANNHVVEQVESGREAWDRLQTYGYDVLIVDWMVPGLSGDQLCRDYRAGGGKLPILMITARVDVEDAEQGFAAGVDDYLRKPFSPQELLCRMLSVLRRKPKREDRVSLIGNITFHHSTRELFVGNKEVLLQPQESTILDYLIRNRSWITPSQLAGQVGDESTTVEAIRTSIMSLRKKISLNGGPPIIITSRGQGYMISDEKSNGEI